MTSDTDAPNSAPQKPIFTDTIESGPRKDILTTTMAEACEMTDDELGRLVMYAGSSIDVRSIGTLKQRVLEYIQVMSFRSSPQKPVTLNRRFNRVARKYGVTVPAILDALLGSGLVTEFEWGGKRGYYSAAVWNEQKAAFPDDIPAMRDRIVANIQ